MGIDFRTKDTMHRVVVKFKRSSLPSRKKPYNLKPVHQPVLDIHGIASKAELYNITTNPKVIVEGFTSALELIIYLLADGYKISTILFELGLRFPGEYTGHENSLVEGKFPTAKIRIKKELREYLKEHVKVVFDGFYEKDGFIGEARDEFTGLVCQTMTRGHILTLVGENIRIDSDREHENDTGVFIGAESGKTYRAVIIPVNEPKMVKLIVPPELKVNTRYTITIKTMSSTGGRKSLLKGIRSITSSFSLLV